MFKNALFISFVLSFCYGQENKEYRFDYKFNTKVDGWLKLHQVPATWLDAKLRCHAEGGILASPLTREFQAGVLEHVTREKDSDSYTIFTGVHATYSKGDYDSVEGVPLSHLFIKWAPEEPNNYKNAEDCLVMSANGTMADVKCSDVFPYVCYKKNFNVVLSECGTHDTDYIFKPQTGSCYKFHRNGKAWPGAYRTCMAEGGHLIIINSDVEAQVLKEIYAMHPDNTIFAMPTLHSYASIGTHLDPGDAGYWMTIHGETPTEAGYNRWQPDEPNNASQPLGEFCGVTHRNNGFLHDAPCYWIMPFICEKSPTSLEDRNFIK